MTVAKNGLASQAWMEDGADIIMLCANKTCAVGAAGQTNVIRADI